MADYHDNAWALTGPGHRKVIKTYFVTDLPDVGDYSGTHEPTSRLINAARRAKVRWRIYDTFEITVGRDYSQIEFSGAYNSGEVLVNWLRETYPDVTFDAWVTQAVAY
jgi:hypothetical protein